MLDLAFRVEGLGLGVEGFSLCLGFGVEGLGILQPSNPRPGGKILERGLGVQPSTQRPQWT